MNTKFTDTTFIQEDNDTFLEYKDLNELKIDQGIESVDFLVGYFPKSSNVTYEEFDKYRKECAWTVTYMVPDGSVDYHHLKHFSSTLELKRKLKNIIEEARGEEYVTLFRNDSLVYL